jgi:hypothetical protein
MRQTRAASRQVEALVEYYNGRLRFEAADKLMVAI